MNDIKEELATAAKVKAQLESLLGKPLDASAEQLTKLWFPAGAYSFSEGQVCSRSILFPGKSCSQAALLDVHGTSSTDANGQRIIMLSDFFCINTFVLADPVNVVATARTATPVNITATHNLVVKPINGFNAVDVQISLFSWAANGNPEPNVAIDWRCRAVSVPIIL
jgi:hypothetical protein